MLGKTRLNRSNILAIPDNRRERELRYLAWNRRRAEGRGQREAGRGERTCWRKNQRLERCDAAWKRKTTQNSTRRMYMRFQSVLGRLLTKKHGHIFMSLLSERVGFVGCLQAMAKVIALQ